MEYRTLMMYYAVWAEGISTQDEKAVHARQMVFPIGAPNGAFARYL